jgi:D-glycero-alpha-D-manno-heptose-7-phosphate kinase
VLSATIDRVAYATLAPRDDGKIRIESLDFGATIEQESRDKLLYDGKLDLIKGAIGRFDSPRSSGFDLFLHTDAPPGTGLGASSAMVVAVIGVLKEFENLAMTDYEIADLAYRIERVDLEIVGGFQDQYSATFGGFNFIEFYGDHAIVNPLRITPEVTNELEHNLVLAYTGSSRLSAGIIDDQVQRYTRGEAQTLRALRDIKTIAVEMKNLLLRRRLDEFGELLGAEWAAKRRMSPKVSTPAIDQMYEEALREGAIGGKVTGAGGGGYMVLYCRFNRTHKVLERLVQLGCTPAQFSFTGTGLQTWRVYQD